MRFGLDTSVVLRLITGTPAKQADTALAWLTAQIKAGHTAIVSDLVVAESYFALIHHFGYSKKESLAALFRMLLSRTVVPTGQAGSVLLGNRLATATPGFVDRLIHAAYLAEGDHWATFEKSAASLPKTTVLKA